LTVTVTPALEGEKKPLGSLRWKKARMILRGKIQTFLSFVRRMLLAAAPETAQAAIFCVDTFSTIGSYELQPTTK
jgi:hypothetical protein